MHYLDSAFAQLEFAIKLMVAAEQGKLTLEDLDIPLTIEDGRSILVLKDRIFSDPQDLINACQNNVSVAFGAAAITLNRCREERGISLPDPIISELEQWTGLVYQIRNAFAHDISEPRWNINGRYKRVYEIRDVRADLTEVNGQHFEYGHVGGPDALFSLRDYAKAAVL